MTFLLLSTNMDPTVAAGAVGMQLAPYNGITAFIISPALPACTNTASTQQFSLALSMGGGAISAHRRTCCAVDMLPRSVPKHTADSL